MATELKNFREIIGWVRSLGYTTRVEKLGSPHPRLYIGCGGQERFTILSTTNNYDKTGWQMKRRDIERDVFPHLPKPQLNGGNVKITADTAAALGKAASGQVKLSDIRTEEKKEDMVDREGMIDPSLKSPISFPMHVSIGGKGDGGLVIRFPIRIKDEFFPDATHCDLLYVEGRHIGLAFGQHGHAKIGGVNGGKSYQCYFARADLPFGIAVSADTENMFGKVTNNALISNTPLPKHFLQGFAPVKGADTMADGIAARKLLNDWLARAKAEGLDPEIVFDSKTCTIAIRVAEVRKVTL